MEDRFLKQVKFDYKKRIIEIGGVKLEPTVIKGNLNFDWGNAGHGSRYTAINLLGHYVSREFAFKHHIQFTDEIISQIPQREYKLEESFIQKWVVRNIRVHK